MNRTEISDLVRELMRKRRIDSRNLNNIGVKYLNDDGELKTGLFGRNLPHQFADQLEIREGENINIIRYEQVKGIRTDNGEWIGV